MDAVISQRTTPFEDFGVLVVCSLVYLDTCMMEILVRLFQDVETKFVKISELLWWSVRYYPHLMKSFC
jgi:hypothetical protein